MGQKVHPVGFRLVLNQQWSSKWFAEGNAYADLLKGDRDLNQHIRKRATNAGISKVEIERATQRIKVDIHAARPGMIIGRKGEFADVLKKELVQLTGGTDVVVNIREIKRPEIDAQLMAENVAGQLEHRVVFRRAMRRVMSQAMRLNVQGCKIMVAGRLNGAEMSRKEWIREGRVPLHTLRANIDYGTAEAKTTYGIIGVKTWVYKEEQNPEVRRLAKRQEQRTD